MAVLTNKSIASTYTSLLSIGSTSTSSLGSSIQSLTDGTGQLSPLAMSTTQIQFNTSTNTFLFPSTRGTINQILKLSDANGTLAWGNESNSNQLDTAGNSGTGSVTLDSQSLTLTGTTNEIVTNANAQSISIGFPTAGVTLPNGSVATTQSIATASVNGLVNNSTTVVLDSNVGTILVGDGVTGIGIVGEVTVATVTDQNNISLSLAQTIVNNVVLSFRDNTTKVATTAYVEAAITAITPPSGDVTKTGTITANQIAVWNDSTDELRSDPTIVVETDHSITLLQTNAAGTDVENYNIGGGNVPNNDSSPPSTVLRKNTGFGKDNLNSLTGGINNVAVGHSSLKSAVGASNNVAIGKDAMFLATSASENIAIGEDALYSNLVSLGNIAIGRDALRLDTGRYNTVVGWQAGATNQEGEFNTYLGYLAGAGNVDDDQNVAIGRESGYFFIAGNNTSIGAKSLHGVYNGSTGDGNTVLGYNSGSAMTTGSKNVIIGSNTGSTIAASDNNIIISDGDGTSRIQVNSGGNVGIGMTPSTVWSTSYNALQIGLGGSIYAHKSAGSAMRMAANVVYEGTAPNYDDKYLTTSTASKYEQDAGSHIWSTAASGTINTAISWSERMRIDGTTGNVGIGTNSPSSYDGESNDLVVASGVDGATPTTGITIACLGDTKSTGRGALRFSDGTSGNEKYIGGVEYDHNSDSMYFRVGGTQKLTITSGGNVGIGITPSPQNLITGSLDLNGGAGIFGYDKRAYLASNVYYQAPSGWKVKEAGYGAFMLVGLTNGDFGFYTTTQGTSANATVTDSRSLHITESGVLEKNGDSSKARIIPETDNVGYLGESSHRWQAVYAVNDTIQTSDRNEKTLITTSNLGLDFILKLEPVSYKWKVGGYDIKENGGEKEPTRTPIEGKRNHYGLIAQQVKEVIGDKDFGGWVKEDLEDDASMESLRYSEFISPMIKAIQEQQTIIEDLKSRIEKLEL